ncbi:type II toxin-antitoxin system VapC family toxin [Acidithiobacillus ferridurans]|uniref:type II toxin-antitoxin system VapC family toxin n=1 Tax=Acidithiobacillus ferridurans TaxID=1232575 RepID=UPI001C07B941|nr:type II toxin-antitoxin system VapC family toxin [Acidithiobacillus ferridurans]MBU2806342.1 type II toxin-antitoxin system VapC family toxin [Acidithiobacillus ferridurans]
MVYLDTSFIAPFFISEDTSDAVENHLRHIDGTLVISDWTRVEFASLLARWVQIKELNVAQADAIREVFDAALLSSFEIWVISSSDCAVAIQLLRDPATGLRAGDALHLGVTHNHHRPHLLSLDQGMVKAARTLSFQASTGISAGAF